MNQYIEEDFTEFEQQINRFFDLIVINPNYESSDNSEDELSKENKKSIFSEIFNNWKIGQSEIYVKMKEFIITKKKYNEELRLANISRNNYLIKEIKEILSYISFKENVFKKLIDSIVWQIFGEEDDVIRRFYRLEEHDLSSSNIEIEWGVVSQLNSEHPLKFALYSDLSSIIQISDTILIDFTEEKMKFVLIEIKSGEKNKQIYNEIKKGLDLRNPTSLDLVKQKMDQSSQKQLDRMILQELKLAHTVKVIEEYEGKDEKGRLINIATDEGKPFRHTEFTPKILEMIKKSEKESFTKFYLEDCLFIGVFNNNPLSEMEFTKWVDNYQKDSIIFNYRDSLYNPAARPPFLLEIPKKWILDLVFGRKSIYFSLNFTDWLKIADRLHIKYKWLSRSESDNILKIDPKYRPFHWKNQILAFDTDNNGYNSLFGFGMIMRIIYNWMLPSDVINAYSIPLSKIREGIQLHNKKN